MPMKPVTVRRWEVIAAFVAITIAFVIGLVILTQTRASVHDLEKTNCGLKLFLLQASKTRSDAAAHETDGRRQNDLNASAGYLVLAKRFQATGHCEIPVRLRGVDG